MPLRSSRRILAAVLLAVPGAVAGMPQAAGPFGPIEGCATVSPAERGRLDAGETLGRTLAGEGQHVSVLGARRVTFDADRLVASVRRIDWLKAGPLVPAIGRFSTVPAASDLDALVLPESDLQAVRRCRPSSCDIKLTAAEIAVMQRELASAGHDWRTAAQVTYRRLVLERVRAYQRGGLEALEAYADGRSPDPPAVVAASIIGALACLSARMPHLAQYLARYPHVRDEGVESFFYWSQERMNDRPVVLVTHVAIARAGERGEHVVVAGRQLLATHYLNGGLNLTMFLDGGSGGRYLLVLNRTHVDMVRGLFGGVTRMVVERRLRSEVTGIVEALVRRMEGVTEAGQAAEGVASERTRTSRRSGAGRGALASDVAGGPGATP